MGLMWTMRSVAIGGGVGWKAVDWEDVTWLSGMVGVVPIIKAE